MATSIGDLLTTLDHASAGRSNVGSGDAAGALDRSARLLARLHSDGLGTTSTSLREDAARRLADACADAALTFETGTGPISDLVGVTSDAVGQLRAELTDDDRWVVATALATTARRCAGTIALSGPYARVPQLLDVTDRARELTRVTTISPAAPDNLTGHDLLIPTTLLPRDASCARAATESMATLVTHLRAAGEGPVSVRALLGACYAGEAVAYAGTAVLGARRGNRQPSSEQAWRRLRAELARFTDRPRRKTETAEPVLRCALRVHDGVQRSLKQPGARGADIELLRRSVLLLPALAGGISTQLHRPTAWIAAGGPRPLHEGRVAEWLQHKPFLARGEDLYPAISALHHASQESHRLAAALRTPNHASAGRNSLLRAPAGAAPLGR